MLGLVTTNEDDGFLTMIKSANLTVVSTPPCALTPLDDDLGNTIVDLFVSVVPLLAMSLGFKDIAEDV